MDAAESSKIVKDRGKFPCGLINSGPESASVAPRRPLFWETLKRHPATLKRRAWPCVQPLSGALQHPRLALATMSFGRPASSNGSRSSHGGSSRAAAGAAQFVPRPGSASSSRPGSARASDSSESTKWEVGVNKQLPFVCLQPRPMQHTRCTLLSMLNSRIFEPVHVSLPPHTTSSAPV